MEFDKTLISIKEYGRVSFHLKEIMDARDIKRNAMARAINTRFEVVDRWYRGEVEKIDVDVLARLCCVLKCQPSDLITYEET